MEINLLNIITCSADDSVSLEVVVNGRMQRHIYGNECKRGVKTTENDLNCLEKKYVLLLI